MSENKIPCLHCEDRSSGCHGRCEEYIAFRKKRDAEKAAKRKRHAREDDYLSVRSARRPKR